MAFFIVIFSLFSQPIWAGWSSSGGEIPTDTQNPWFIQNTPKITYCITIDDAHFGAPLEIVRSSIKKAFAYWQKNFDLADQYDPTNWIKLGGHTFIEEECSLQTMIQFQMGVLNAAQESFLGDPTHYVGIAVRTDYDLKELRGKGFVYIAPAEGRLRPSAERFHRDIWQKAEGRNLEKVLAHEIGHVFGMQHIFHGNGDFIDLMADDLPISVFEGNDPYSAQIIEPRYFYPSRSGGTASYQSCFLEPKIFDPSSEGCIAIDMQFRSGPEEITVYNSGDSLGLERTLVGSGAAAAGATDGSLRSPLAKMVLTDTQRVFPPSQLSGDIYSMVPYYVEYDFQNVSGERFKLFLDIAPHEIIVRRLAKNSQGDFTLRGEHLWGRL